ncbi:2-amino-3,7-dideoxy-D-threo-hept-6-ulosonate synthase [Promicromonospora xylanilytica]
MSMLSNYPFGRSLRMLRLGQMSRRFFVVPLDHSVTNGPISFPASLDALVGGLAGAGVDAVVLHKGRVREIDPSRFTHMSLIIHLSASTRHAPDPDAKRLVANVEEAVRVGADAVSVHVNLGSRHETEQLRDLATVAEACDRWNLPLLAMVYPRGPELERPHRPELVEHAVAVAVDLGADLVKTLTTESPADMRGIVDRSPVPILTAGGPKVDETRLIDDVAELLRAGTAGVAMGRNIFESPDPAALARRIADLIHIDAPEPRLTVPPLQAATS